MLPANLTGIVLDDKYKIERELGRGGMGAVYLATHVGTERPVAVKVITPEFTGKDEFVERFRREARAAGRLRHPNVVDVTDFGFAPVAGESVAYLVMEYLDGCSLAQILAEEERLPLAWVVDILEQVSAAVEEAHKKGIVHRDLKPDNIWLEPNRRGGYTVKVLDFGLAKLAARSPGFSASDRLLASQSPVSTKVGDVAMTNPVGQITELRDEALTQIQAPPDEQSAVGTQILPPPGANARETNVASSALPGRQTQVTTPATTGLETLPDLKETATQILPTQLKNAAGSVDGRRVEFAAAEEAQTMALPPVTSGREALATEPADGLTRVGSILGTPLYMSPEQCAGQALDYKTDIYSLGAIAYQMLTGRPPFTGNSLEVIKQHGEVAPVPIRKIRRKVPRQMARTVAWALEKDPSKRIDSAAGFASAMRASLDTTGVLLRRGFALFSEHFTKLFMVSLIAQLPLIAIALARLAITLIEYTHGVRQESLRLATEFSSISGLYAFFASALIIGVTIRLVTQLYVAPLRPLNLRPALLAVKKRFWPLVYTVFMVGLGSIIGLILLVIPGLVFYMNSSVSAPVVVMEGLRGRKAIKRSKMLVKRSRPTVIAILLIQYLIPTLAGSISVAPIMLVFKAHNMTMLASSVSSLLTDLFNILIVPFIAVLTALLYLKTRMVGGEVLQEMLSEFEEQGAPKTQWQMRMRSTVYSTPSK